MCCYLYRTVAEFKGDCNFEGTSTASNYGTASESDEWISISVSTSIVPGFTTSPNTLRARHSSDWDYNIAISLQKQVDCFNHRVVTLVADKLKKQWLLELYIGIKR